MSPSIEPARLSVQLPAQDDAARRPCSFCGARAGIWQMRCQADSAIPPVPTVDVRACPLCALSQHLERPRIDEEAVLAWLPEMSQQAVNATMREIHMRLRLLRQDLHFTGAFRGAADANLRALHFGRAVLSERIGGARDRVGTDSPRELGLALLELPTIEYSRRGALLGGLRLLPLGRFYDGDMDVYPDIVDAWLKPSLQVESNQDVVRYPTSRAPARPPAGCFRKFRLKG